MPKKITLLGFSLAAAMLLSYVEACVPVFVSVPGIKLGLANIAVIFTLFCFGIREACLVSFIRVLLSSLLFGNAVSLIYALSGAVLSLAAMTLIKRINRFSVFGISIIGAVMHNIGQIISATVILGSEIILLYLPLLILSGTVSGALIGILAGIVIKRIEPKLKCF